jgi:hypothetical protein
LLAPGISLQLINIDVFRWKLFHFGDGKKLMTGSREKKGYSWEMAYLIKRNAIIVRVLISPEKNQISKAIS